MQEGGEVHRLVAIGVDGLSQQDHFPDSASGQYTQLCHQRGYWHAAFAPADIRDDAEGTKSVASAHDSHISAHAAFPIWVEIGVSLVTVQAYVDYRIETGVGQHPRQLAISIGACDQVQVRCLAEQRGAIVLSHAAYQP